MVETDPLLDRLIPAPIPVPRSWMMTFKRRRKVAWPEFLDDRRDMLGRWSSTPPPPPAAPAAGADDDGTIPPPTGALMTTRLPFENLRQHRVY
jgi:hypothetical protein